MRYLALPVCVLFVIFLLKHSIKKSDQLSSAVWVPTLWVFTAGSKPIAHWFPGFTSSLGDTDGSPLDQIFLGALIILAFIILANRNISWREVIKDNLWIFIFILYIGISTLWSDYTLVSFKRFIRIVGTVLCGLVIMSESEPLIALSTVFRRTGYVLIPFSLLLVKYFPEYGIEYGRWGGARMPIGVCVQKNGLGMLCMLIVFFLVWDFVRKKQLKILLHYKNQTRADILILLISFYLLKGADTNVYSATSVGVLIIGMCLLFVFSKFRGRPEYITNFIVVILICLMVVLIFINLLEWSAIGWWANFLGRERDLTGRVDIWADVFAITPRWTFLGTGYGGFWGHPYSFDVIGQKSGHSGYLDVYVELGFVGVLFLLIFFVKFVREMTNFAMKNFDWGILGICFLFLSVVYNYTESDFLNTSSLLWTFFLIMTISLSRQARTK